MREIPNVKFTDTETAVSLLTICLNSVPPGGLDFATIRTRNRVADAIEKIGDGDTIKLEDSDYTAAQEAIKTTRWATRNKHLIQFAELFGL